MKFCINNLKRTNHLNAFRNGHLKNHTFLIKILRKLQIEWEKLALIKGIYEKPIENKDWKEGKYALPLYPIQH